MLMLGQEESPSVLRDNIKLQLSIYAYLEAAEHRHTVCCFSHEAADVLPPPVCVRAPCKTSSAPHQEPSWRLKRVCEGTDLNVGGWNHKWSFYLEIGKRKRDRERTTVIAVLRRSVKKLQEVAERAEKMLTDTIVEEEFELKEEEPWYDRQDLEHDLQLAAELGKSLLERNKELEQGLQQMCSSNQEQLQEIEVRSPRPGHRGPPKPSGLFMGPLHMKVGVSRGQGAVQYLSKQVDVLRQVNDQHAKVYEQLDVAARELEQNNHKLVLDKRTAQQKIQGLMETVELLQTQVDELQRQLEDVRLSPGRRHWEPRAARGARSVSCLQELQNSLRYEDEPPDAVDSTEVAWWEEERASLQHSLRALQTQFAGERARREELQREAQLLTGENAALEQQVSGMEACRVRVAELELEVEELRQLWESSSRSGPAST
ncbi:Cerebellar degeneration-related protein 2 [Takifugu flavidus]|uniref:Cerebellar degeneration-related protein 2 n=1 Tax=Takifugu flavidus TaxID=433684 RepID=A0A5C6PRI7_9TELE|nr:Cerebellar degeneration-related protein 2 [Takifugu flavidus]